MSEAKKQTERETMTKPFHVRDILTATTGRLLTAPKDGGNGIGALYDFLGWVTGEQPFTHTLGRFAEEARPWIYSKFPLLMAENDYCEVALSGVDEAGMADAIERYVDAAAERLGGEFLDVPQMPAGAHETRNPLAELIEMRGGDHGVMVVGI